MFQRFSNAIAHIVKTLTGYDNINYLDDFFFAAESTKNCNRQVETFISVCQSIRFTLSKEKTIYASGQLTFLGLLIDTFRQLVCVPSEKISKAHKLITNMLERKKSKLRYIQRISGYLNFLCKAVIPGRTYTRRLYSLTAGVKKPHQHVYLTKEIKDDLRMWQNFLSDGVNTYYKPFFRFSEVISSIELDWYTDAATTKGFGGYNDQEWFIGDWPDEFVEKRNVHINFLELYAVTVGIMLWLQKYRNKNIVIFCDNMSVIHMLNKGVSKCKSCMVLLRLITLKSMQCNTMISAKHISTDLNIYSDLLSRLEYKQFKRSLSRMEKKFDRTPCQIPQELHDVESMWFDQS